MFGKRRLCCNQLAGFGLKRRAFCVSAPRRSESVFVKRRQRRLASASRVEASHDNLLRLFNLLVAGGATAAAAKAAAAATNQHMRPDAIGRIGQAAAAADAARLVGQRKGCGAAS